MSEFPGLSKLINNDTTDPVDQLHYDYQDTIDMVHQLLTDIGKIQYRAHQAGMSHLQFELWAEPPTLHDLTYETVNTYPGDNTWSKMRYTEVMAEHRLYIYGDFFTLKEHFEPYIFVAVVSFGHSPERLNWKGKNGRCILRAPWLTAKLERAKDEHN